MASTNTNGYASFGKSMYTTSIPQVEYEDLAHSTTRPNAKVNVMNPYDRTYVQFQDGFNKNLLNANQNDPTIVPRSYYTISKAYGQPPLKTQAQRTCAGSFKA